MVRPIIKDLKQVMIISFLVVYVESGVGKYCHSMVIQTRDVFDGCREGYDLGYIVLGL